MEAFIGTIILFAGGFAPQGWAFCDGQQLSIAQNTALFSLLGTEYGGDGVTTFNLPTIGSTTLTTIPVAENYLRYIICLNGIYPSRG